VERSSSSALRCIYLCRLAYSGKQRQRLLLRSKKKGAAALGGTRPANLPSWRWRARGQSAF
jgi:hypothetical protein